jgi:hypothetical protein
MATNDNETDLIERAIRALETETKLRVRLVARDLIVDERPIDALLQVNGAELLELKAEVKAWAQHINTGALIKRVEQLGQNGILVTDYVNPNLADKLRDNGVQFMDICGNAFIHAPGVHIFIKGMKHKNANYPPQDRTNRAFNTTGLKVTYILLRNPNMVDAPYREIAEEGGVALGTVGWVMQDLKNAGYLITRGGKRLLRNYEKLLQRWVEAYPEKLKPKIVIGNYLAENPDWWENLPINEFDAQWGGEIAAAKFTNYLKPEIATIYAADTAKLADLFKTTRLRKLNEENTTNGMKVHIYKTFCKPGKENRELVDPILVYTDLIATGDPRNREVAQEIYEKYITERFRENQIV